MGVPGLFPWITRNCREAVSHFQMGTRTFKVDGLYLDANGPLHGMAQEVFHYGQGKKFVDRYASLSYEAKCMKVYQMFFENLVELTSIVQPQKVLYIAIDGPAPLAKQAQQRQRRFGAAKMRLEAAQEETAEVSSSSSSTAAPSSSSSSEVSSKVTKFDSNSITPGTRFMHNLTRYVYYAIRKEMNGGALSDGMWKNLKVIFSPPTVPGEGEHKIMDYMRSLPERTLQNDRHCIFGPDGDLIMLTLAAHLEKMFLFRSDQYNQGWYHFLDMGVVRKKLSKILYQNPGVHSGLRDLNDVTDDFIVEGFFVGNDFLPKIQMFHLLRDGLDFMANAYAKTSDKGRTNFLTIDNHISLEGFRAFIQKISESEETFLIEQITTRDPKKIPPEERYINTTLKEHVHTKLKSGELRGDDVDTKDYRIDYEGYRLRYYTDKLKFGQDTLDEQIEKLCWDYFRSFVWVFEYYVHGLPAWRWAYEYHYAPLMKDFRVFVENLSDEKFKELSEFTLQKASLPFEQLLSVLPPPSAELLPRALQRLVLRPQSPLVKMGYYPETFEVDCEGKLKEHECVTLLSFVDYDVIHENYEKMVGCCIKHPEKYHRNEIGTPVYFVYDGKYTAKFKCEFGEIPRLHIQKKNL